MVCSSQITWQLLDWSTEAETAGEIVQSRRVWALNVKRPSVSLAKNVRTDIKSTIYKKLV